MANPIKRTIAAAATAFGILGAGCGLSSQASAAFVHSGGGFHGGGFHSFRGFHAAFFTAISLMASEGSTAASRTAVEDFTA